MRKIPVLVADTSYLVRAGVEYVVDAQSDMELVGAVDKKKDLFRLIKSNRESVLILDYHGSKAFDKSTVYEIIEQFEDQKLIIITKDTNRQNIYELIENGVNCFLTKECGRREILDAIYAVERNEKFFCGKILNFILEKSFQKEDDPCMPTPLTPREMEVVKLVAEGKVAKEIATELDISPHTIYTHRKSILKKLKVTSTAELVKFAIANKLISTAN